MTKTASASERTMLTTAEAAAFLNVSVHTVARWVRQGRLVAYSTPGRGYRFKRRDVEGVLRPVEASEQAS